MNYSNSGSPVKERPPKELQQVLRNKLNEILGHNEEVLPEYIMVMISNFRNRDQVAKELEDFLPKHASAFTKWLWQILKSDSYPTLVIPPTPAELLRPAKEDTRALLDVLNGVPPARTPAAGMFDYVREPESTSAVPPTFPSGVASAVTSAAPARDTTNTSTGQRSPTQRSRSRRDDSRTQSRPRARSPSPRRVQSRSRRTPSPDRRRQRSPPRRRSVSPPRRRSASPRRRSPVRRRSPERTTATQTTPLIHQHTPTVASVVIAPQRRVTERIQDDRSRSRLLSLATDDAVQSIQTSSVQQQSPVVYGVIGSTRPIQQQVAMMRPSSGGKQKRTDEDETQFVVTLSEAPRRKSYPPAFHEKYYVPDVEYTFNPIESHHDKRVKSHSKCRDWPNCPRGDACHFHHPSELCTQFPSCSYGPACLYVHPSVPCAYGVMCKRPSCAYQHPSKGDIPCKFGAGCTNHTCSFAHPSPIPSKHNKPCRYGASCSRSNCAYEHYQVSS